MIRVVKWGVGGLLAVVMVALGGLWLFPPELLRVADGYAAKIVCSNVFIAGRDAQQVLRVDVQAPGHPALKWVSVSVDPKTQRVRAHFLGIFAGREAKFTPGYGCILRSGSAQIPVLPQRAASSDLKDTGPKETGALWPQSERVAPVSDAAIARALSDTALTGPGMRAVVVVRDGRIVGETYGRAFGPQTPLLGWSMTKTVTAALIGRAVADGHLKVTDDHLRPEWTDERAKITVGDLLAMNSGLAFNEDYGDVSDVTRMLYLEPDMARFTAQQPLQHAPGTAFNYSTGTPVLLSWLWQQRLGVKAADYPQQALFAPLGMRSAVLEPDDAGTYAGGSYLYATARDWARFGLFLMQDGVWEGRRLLPEAFAARLRTPNPVEPGYTQAQSWRISPGETRPGEAGLPSDTVWLRGHDGQSIAVIPSQRLVVVRMGLTPSELNYRPSRLVRALLGQGVPQ